MKTDISSPVDTAEFSKFGLVYTLSALRIHCLSLLEYQCTTPGTRVASPHCLLCDPEHRQGYEDNIIGGNKGILGHLHSDADILQIPASILVQLCLLLVFYFDLCDLSSTRDGPGISELIMDQVLSWALYKYYLFYF